MANELTKGFTHIRAAIREAKDESLDTPKVWPNLLKELEAALQTIDSLTSQLASRASEVERLRERLQSAERLAARVIEIFQPMQDKGQNGHTFELLLDRAKMFALAQQEPPRDGKTVAS